MAASLGSGNAFPGALGDPLAFRDRCVNMQHERIYIGAKFRDKGCLSSSKIVKTADAKRFKTRGTARRSAAWDAEQGYGGQGRGTRVSFR